MNFIKHNWQLKLLALGLAVVLWLVLHWQAPLPTPGPIHWPAPFSSQQ